MYDPLSLLGLRENGEFCTTLRCKPLEQDENALHKYNSANAKCECCSFTFYTCEIDL